MKTLTLVTASTLALMLPAVASAQNWSGPYVGAQIGQNRTELELRYDDGVTNERTSDDFDNTAYGAFAGVNAQNGNWVMGAEIDLNYNDANDRYTVLGEPLEVGIDYSGSVRGRVGYSFGDALVYGALGVAGTRAYIEYDGEKETETIAGVTGAVGMDYAFGENLFGRAEYRYTDFGDTKDGNARADLTQQSVFLGLGYRF